MMRKVVCSAIMYEGVIYCGARHSHIFAHMVLIGLNPKVYKPMSTQGFIDEDNIFMTREEAFEVATRAGQLTEDKLPPKKKLISEDLY